MTATHRPENALALLLRGITLATVARLSSLQQLTSLTTDLNAPRMEGRPVDLAEYAHFTGALQGSCHPDHEVVGVLSCRAMCGMWEHS